MRLNKLSLTNFRQHARTRIAFESGLTGIIGPNGAGKTTILEAIAWALYGNMAIRGNRDSIRFLGAGARAPVEVELEFELGSHRYRVVRSLTSAEVYLATAYSQQYIPGAQSEDNSIAKIDSRGDNGMDKIVACRVRI